MFPSFDDFTLGETQSEGKCALTQLPVIPLGLWLCVDALSFQ